MNKKRILCLVLTVLMFVSLAFPASVFAEDEWLYTDEYIDDYNVEYINEYDDGSAEAYFEEENFIEDVNDEEFYVEEYLNEEFYDEEYLDEESYDEDTFFEEEKNLVEQGDDEPIEEFLAFNDTETFDAASELSVTKPEDNEVPVNTMAAFSVSVSGGTAPYTYQWQYKADGDWANLGGGAAKTANLTLNATGARDGWQVRCIVTDANNKTATSEAATLTVVISSFEIDNVIYEVIASTTNVLVKSYNGNAASVTIPTSVTKNGQTYNVTKIGAGAFEENTVITEVSLPNSIETIGERAFKNCTNLRNMTTHD